MLKQPLKAKLQGNKSEAAGRNGCKDPSGL